MVTSYTDPWAAPATFGLDEFGSPVFGSTEEAATAFQPFAGDAAAFRSPAEDWARLQTGMSPFWQQRAPMQDMATRMMGRYYLGAPYAATEARPSPTFADYLSQYAGGSATAPAMANLETLRQRAREAAQASTFVGGPAAYVAASQDPTQFARRSSYASLFGQDAENQAANQLAVAQMMAMQRVDPETGGAGGTYRGTMASVIRNALQRIQQHRGAQGAPRETFLSWYLDKYHPKAAEAPTAAPRALYSPTVGEGQSQ